MTQLPTPEPGQELAWVRAHLGHLTLESQADLDVVASPRFRGGQSAADDALAGFDVRGYAGRRSEVLPRSRRGASALSPYIRHGLLPLAQVWDAVAGGPARDVDKFRDELLWQEYSRHLYARLGTAMSYPLRAEPPAPSRNDTDPYGPGMACVDAAIGELHTDGWMVNQTRMWMASHWAVRHGARWQDGEDEFFRHLLDGSRAANRAGWQWTIGTATGKPYGFSRWQVEKRAPELCAQCSHQRNCPIQKWPRESAAIWLDEPDSRIRRDPDPLDTAGPAQVQYRSRPDAVWITAESLGDGDPALRAHPQLPVVFVFDEGLLRRLKLSGKRLVFLTESLADLSTRRSIEVHLGAPTTVLAGRPLAATFAPVPGWRRLSAHLDAELVEVHPWPWLRPPGSGPVGSFSAWRTASPR